MRHQFDGLSSEYPAGESLVDLLRRRASALGDKQAFCFISGDGSPEVAITYRQLDERARAIAGQLQALAPRGARAILLYPPGLDFVGAFFGCLYAGIMAVPIASPGRGRFAWSAESIVEASKPSLVLSTARHYEEAIAPRAPRALLERRWVATEQIGADAGNSWQDPRIDGRDMAFLQYTSGSTSAPKGVMLSHGNLLHNAAIIRRAFGNRHESSAVFWLPLYHDMGLIGGVIQPIHCAGSCTLISPVAFLQRPALWLETISRTGATVAGGPDFAFDLCARKGRAEDRSGLDLSQWEVAFVGAERIRAQTLQRFAEAFAPCGFRPEAFFPCYGLAEATLMVSGGPRRTVPSVIFLDAVGLAHRRLWDAPRNDPSSRGLVACGEILPGQRIVIADPETCLRCGDDEIGEIWVQGPSVARGYYGQPEATAAAFDGYLADSREGPFLRTGDLGFLRDGQLYVTGRLKDLIIIRGRNLYPEDIELSAERACEGLRPGCCAAFSVDADDREMLAVVQEVEPRSRDLDTQQALHAIRHAIAARHEVEVHAVALVRAGSIPKTSSGKTRRSTCREHYLSGEMEILAEWRATPEGSEEEPTEGHFVLHPRTVTAKEVEAWLTRRLATRLRLKPSQVQAATPFIEFGMSSLDAVEIAAELARWLGRPLSPTAIYNYPTVAALARWLARSSADSPAPHVKQPPPRLLDKPDPDRMRQEVQQMTNEEMEAFISREMASIRQELAE
jgi:acyl-CoA synthetase (AMP-forming)/AMP-acid ligase II/acyl carrier protein